MRALALLACFTTTACTRLVDPPPRPPATMPALEPEPPEPESGLARVLISTDVPARVVRVSSGVISSVGLRSRSLTLSDLLCDTTPCAVTLPYGDHEIELRGLRDGTRHSKTTVHVRRPTEIVNHTLGKSTLNPGQALGGFVALTSAVVLGVGLGLAAGAEARHQSAEGPRDVAVGGLVGVVGGLVIMGMFPSTRQEGSTTQWSPERAPAGGRTIGGSWGFRF